LGLPGYEGEIRGTGKCKEKGRDGENLVARTEKEKGKKKRRGAIEIKKTEEGRREYENRLGALEHEKGG